MEVLSIQQHARDTLSRLRMRKRNKNWARDHMSWGNLLEARLKGGLGGTGELGMGCRWAVSARLGCTGRSRGCTEAVWRLGVVAVWRLVGAVGAAQRLRRRLGWRLSGCAGLHKGLVAVWWLRRWLHRGCAGGWVGGCLVAQGCTGGWWLSGGCAGGCPRLRRRLKVVAVGFRVWAAVEAD
ncbi:hypothetical protein Acr_01g0007060 [Actinidia rufa]|uniref:Uncharacterized protein n=1 Tax=Actinidia rufa TaxID=165716 RepID=A0A7J0E5G7_9ERIC|nr:hypothetical protein Acr_01g0007060 [Actinidia rufa]